MRRALLLCLCLMTPRTVLARPDWAQRPDAADATGHSFVCEGSGPSDAAALAAAFGACNDKICKVCGVEVESVLRTKETLTNVSVERQVVERCRRVRKREPVLKYKTVDCGPSGCRAWVQVFYSKADEEAECPRYAEERFADPERCEVDIDEFAKVRGHTAESFKARRAALDRALVDCKDIDVRPTPALTALDAKLHAGLDSFESTGAMRFESEPWEYFTRAPAGMREELKQTRTLLGRIQRIRDYMHDRVLVFSVYDAAWAPDIDTPAGVQRLLAAMQRCPPGMRFGARDDVNIAVLWRLEKLETDTAIIGDHLRKAYPVESLRCLGTILSWDRRLVRFFIGDRKITPAEWDYAVRISKTPGCDPFFGWLIEAPDHGGDDVRLERLIYAWNSMRAAKKVDRYGTRDLMPADPGFLMRVQERLPAELRATWDAWMLAGIFAGAKRDASVEEQRAAAQLEVAALARQPVNEEGKQYCAELDGRLQALEKAGAPGLEAVDRMVCWCLKEPLSAFPERYPRKQGLVARSLARRLNCRCPYDPAKTHAALKLGKKPGQDATLDVQADPAWHACAKPFETSRLRLKLYRGSSQEAVARATSADVILHIPFNAPRASQAVENLCDGQPAFIGWELDGEGEYGALDTKRSVVPIRCR